LIIDGSVAYHDDLAPLMQDIDSVHPHPENYNNGDTSDIRDSIMVSGMYRPIYVQRSTGDIVAGNHAWGVCKELGATQIPLVQLDIDNTTAKRIMVADNEIARNARPDNGLLLALLTELSETDTLIGTGYDDQRLLQLATYVEMPMDDESDHKSWPSLCFQVPPHVKEAFLAMTDVAGGDRERFELMMRLAGWGG
jgi:hypothetical protein